MTLLLILAMLAGGQDISPTVKKKLDVARAALEKSPEDPKANLDLGKLLCFDLGEWAEGLPLLAKGGDKEWAAAVEKDLGPKPTVFHSVEAADAWFTLSAKNKPLASQLKARAMVHYAEAWPKTEAGPTREIVRGKLKAIQSKGPESRALGAFPAGSWTGNNRAGLDREFAYSGAASVKVLSGDPKVKGPQSFFTADILCAPGAKVTFSCWTLTSGGESGMGRVHLKFRDAKQGAGEHLAMHTIAVNPDLPIWTKQELEVMAPAGTVRAEIAFGFGPVVGGSAWVDDFSLKCDGREQLKNWSFDGK